MRRAHAQLLRPPLRLGRGVAVRDAVRRRPGQALARGRHDRLRPTASTPPPSPRRCAPTASSTSSRTASSAATSCASACSRRSSPTTSQALTACIDWIVDAAGGRMTRVLVAENIGDSGIDAARGEHFDVDTGTDWAEGELEERDRRLRRHPHPLGDEGRRRTLIDQRRPSCKAIGRAGVGVDNVDVPAATKRGIVVANAPQSNVVTAAEHTMALLLALARNVPQAHALADRGRAGTARSTRASSCMDKTLGILGFGRIGQLVAQRAQGFGMQVVAFDPYVGAERYTRARRRAGRASDDVYAVGRLHHRAPAEDAGDRGLARRRGVREDEGRRARPQRRPRAAHRRRGPPGRARLRQGRRRGARRLPHRADHRPPALRLPERRSSRRTSARRPPRPPTAPATRPPSRSSRRSPAAA